MFHLYAQYEYWLAASQLGLAMLGMGATLKVRDFATVVRSPKGIVVGTTIQIIGVPLLAALFLWGFKLDTGVAVDLALVAAIPGGTMSNVFTFLGRGHAALSIALTGVATLACLVTTPIILSLLVQQHMPVFRYARRSNCRGNCPDITAAPGFGYGVPEDSARSS